MHPLETQWTVTHEASFSLQNLKPMQTPHLHKEGPCSVRTTSAQERVAHCHLDFLLKGSALWEMETMCSLYLEMKACQVGPSTLGGRGRWIS